MCALDCKLTIGTMSIILAHGQHDHVLLISRQIKPAPRIVPIATKTALSLLIPKKAKMLAIQSAQQHRTQTQAALQTHLPFRCQIG